MTKPVFIDLTRVFSAYSGPGPTKTMRFNPANIETSEALTGGSMKDSGAATSITMVSGNKIFVQETEAEIDQKIEDTEKPKSPYPPTTKPLRVPKSVFEH